MKTISIFLLTLLLAACTRNTAIQQDGGGSDHDPQDSTGFLSTLLYKREIIQDFIVLINPDVLSHSTEAAELQEELNSQLAAINKAIPPASLTVLKQSPIWVEWEKRRDKAAEFHVSEIWLAANGYNPDKIGGVELSNSRNFIEWSRNGQPWMVLHELSHAYYHSALEWRWEEVGAAYKQAMSSGLYESVPHINGDLHKAYAALNQEEYFAELSEAYFGKNDFFPFTRDELKKYDPVGFQLMQDTWE